LYPKARPSPEGRVFSCGTRIDKAARRGTIIELEPAKAARPEDSTSRLLFAFTAGSLPLFPPLPAPDGLRRDANLAQQKTTYV